MKTVLSERIHKDLSERVVRLGDEIDKMISLTCQAREALEHEMFEPGGFLKTELRPAYLTKMNALARQIDMLVGAKIRWDKNQASLAKSMTPEQEKAAVRNYVRSLGKDERYEFLRYEVEYHQRQHAGPGSPSEALSDRLS